MASREDVARMAGVSGATVSRSFNSPDDVSEKTLERVMEAAKKLEYEPNTTARNLIRGKTSNVGVVLPYMPRVHLLSAYYFSEILSGIAEGLSQNDYLLTLFFECNVTPEQEGYNHYFYGNKVDGIVFLGTRIEDKAIKSLMKTNKKFCLVSSRYLAEKNSSVNFIDTDNVKGAFLATEYLIEKGHKSIAFVNGGMDFTNSTDRLKGYKKALKKYSIEYNDDIVFEGNYGRKSGYNNGKKIAGMEKLPTAVFTANDRMAFGVIEALKQSGISVPDDVDVIGYDDSNIATLSTPTLTTVKTDYYSIGFNCAIEFIKYIESQSKDRFQIFTQPELIIRNSTS